jgi:hypothetical protein
MISGGAVYFLRLQHMPSEPGSWSDFGKYLFIEGDLYQERL